MQESVTDVQQQYDLLDSTSEALDRGLLEIKPSVNGTLNKWIGTLREEGFPEIAFEMENLQEAIHRAEGLRIRDSLMRLGHLTEQASGKADGMMKKKVQDIGRMLLQAARVFNTDDGDQNDQGSSVG